MFNCVVLRFGYVEDTQLGFLCFTGPEFETRTDALKSLGHYLYRKYKSFHPSNSRPDETCCAVSRQAQNDFCGKCGRRLHPLCMDWEMFRTWMVYEMPIFTADDWGDDYDLEDVDEWNAWDDAVSRIVNNAKSLVDLRTKADGYLIDALLLNPESIDAEDRNGLTKTSTDRGAWWRENKTLEQYLEEKENS